jgi:hypothetical protein
VKSILNASLLEADVNELIKYGGPSSSQLLTEIVKAAVNDISSLKGSVSDLSEDVSQLKVLALAQGAAASQMVSRLETLLSALSSSSSTKLVDFFSMPTIVESSIEGNPSGDVRTMISTFYGQVTLPILYSINRIAAMSTASNEGVEEDWVPPSVTFEGHLLSSPTGVISYSYDETGKNCLVQDPRSVWYKTRKLSDGLKYLWVRVEFAQDLTSTRYVNSVILHPFPYYRNNLVWIGLETSAGTLEMLNMSYLPRYNANTGKVENCGPVRLIFSPVQAKALQVCLEGPYQSGDDTVVPIGFSYIGVRLYGFGTAGRIVFSPFSNLNPSTSLKINEIYGYNPSTLSRFLRVVEDNEGHLHNVEISLTQQSQYYTPVITGVVVGPAA